jgi:putative peptidoglycan lipid II flippase
MFGADTWQGLFLLSASVTVAGITMLAGVFGLLKTSGLKVIPRFWPMMAEVKRIARLTLPMMIPIGVSQVSSLFDSLYSWFMSATPESPNLHLFGFSIAKPLEPGVVTCLYAAERLYNFPLAILAVSLATVVFPLFSRYAARGDVAGLRDAANRSLRLSLFLGIPSGVALILLASPTIVLIFRWGQFHPGDVNRTVLILQMYSLGMWAYFCRHILLRAFFCQKDAMTPLKVSCVLAVGNILLVAGLVFTRLGGGAIGLATALNASVNVLLLTWILRRRWGRIGFRKILASLGRTLLATALMGLAIVLVRYAFGAGTPTSKRAAAVIVFGGIAAGIAAFVAAAAVLRCRELGELWGTVRGKASLPGSDQAGRGV